MTILCLTEITPVCVTVAVDASFSVSARSHGWGVLTGSQFPVIRQIWTEKHRAQLSGFPDWIISQWWIIREWKIMHFVMRQNIQQTTAAISPLYSCLLLPVLPHIKIQAEGFKPI